MAGRLEGKRIIITGAAGGIGAATVKQFIREGARVVIADLNERGAQEVAHSAGPACHVIHCDVSSENDVRRMIEGSVAWLGGLDGLVNNAGLQYAGKVTDFDSALWDRLMAVNVRAHFFTAKYAVPYLRQAGGGTIINTSSVAGQRGAPGVTGYATSKGAVIAFSIALALELAPDKIRVNCVCPGWVDTPFNEPAINFMGGPKVQENMIKATVPLGRQATPDEIAPLYVYLTSDESSYMTAKVIGIDGGEYN